MSLTDTIIILTELKDMMKDCLQTQMGGKWDRDMALSVLVPVEPEDVYALEEALDRLDGIKRIQQMLYPESKEST